MPLLKKLQTLLGLILGVYILTVFTNVLFFNSLVKSGEFWHLPAYPATSISFHQCSYFT